jgi:hypothetical protein
MQGCTGEGGNWEYCQCALNEIEKQWSEYDTPTDDQIGVAVQPCLDLYTGP